MELVTTAMEAIVVIVRMLIELTVIAAFIVTLMTWCLLTQSYLPGM